MLTPDEWSPSRLRYLSEQECRGLLHGHRIGRVALCAADGPAVLPVNYLSDGDTVLFRTSPHTELALALLGGAGRLRDRRVRRGHPVRVERGRAGRRGAPGPRRAAAAGRSTRSLGAGGTRNFYVRIVVDRVTGRRLLPP